MDYLKKKKAHSIIKDSTLPSHGLFILLPCGKQYHGIRATTKRSLFSCSGCYHYKLVPFRAIEHVTLSVNQLQFTNFLRSWLASIFGLRIFVFNIPFSSCCPFSSFFPFTISPFQKYPAQTQSSVHSRLPQNVHLSQVCFSSTITLYIIVFCIVCLSFPLKALEWRTQYHQHYWNGIPKWPG